MVEEEEHSLSLSKHRGCDEPSDEAGEDGDEEFECKRVCGRIAAAEEVVEDEDVEVDEQVEEVMTWNHWKVNNILSCSDFGKYCNLSALYKRLGTLERML